MKFVKHFRALWWNVLGIGSLLMMCAYAGMVIFAYYDINKCDPVKAGVRKPFYLQLREHS